MVERTATRQVFRCVDFSDAPTANSKEPRCVLKPVAPIAEKPRLCGTDTSGVLRPGPPARPGPSLSPAVCALRECVAMCCLRGGHPGLQPGRAAGHGDWPVLLFGMPLLLGVGVGVAAADVALILARQSRRTAAVKPSGFKSATTVYAVPAAVVYTRRKHLGDLALGWPMSSVQWTTALAILALNAWMLQLIWVAW